MAIVTAVNKTDLIFNFSAVLMFIMKRNGITKKQYCLELIQHHNNVPLQNKATKDTYCRSCWTLICALKSLSKGPFNTDQSLGAGTGREMYTVDCHLHSVIIDIITIIIKKVYLQLTELLSPQRCLIFLSYAKLLNRYLKTFLTRYLFLSNKKGRTKMQNDPTVRRIGT